MASFLPASFCLAILPSNLSSTYGPFFVLLDICFLFYPTVFNNVLVGVFLQFTGFATQCTPTPRRLGTLHTDARSAFATAMRMSGRVHGHTTDGRTDTHVAFAAGFA